MSELRRAQLGQLGLLGRPALVVVDVQRDFGDPECLGEYELRWPVLAALDQAVTRIGFLADTARSIGVPVAWVELGSDPARP